MTNLWFDDRIYIVNKLLGCVMNFSNKKILSVVLAGVMAVGSAGLMTGCNVLGVLPGVVQVEGPNGETVTTTIGEIKKIITNLPEMLKKAADPTYENQNVKEINGDTLTKFSAFYSIDYLIDGFGVFNEENLKLLQQTLPEKADAEDVTLPIPRGLVGYNDMLYSIQDGKIIKNVMKDDGSISSETLAYNVKFLVPKSIEIRNVGSLDLEYVTYYTCCGTDHDYETHYNEDNEDGDRYYYTYPTKSFHDLQKLTKYISEAEQEGITINYCEHTKPLFEAYFASLQEGKA